LNILGKVTYFSMSIFLYKWSLSDTTNHNFFNSLLYSYFLLCSTFLMLYFFCVCEFLFWYVKYSFGVCIFIYLFINTIFYSLQEIIWDARRNVSYSYNGFTNRFWQNLAYKTLYIYYLRAFSQRIIYTWHVHSVPLFILFSQ
jgi:hypothetical protein